MRRLTLACLALATVMVAGAEAAPLEPQPGDHLCIIGNTLPERMQHDGYLETLIQSRFPTHELVIRNLAFSADELTVRLRSDGFGTPDDHLRTHEADLIFAFFGFNESFAGEVGLGKFRADLDAFIKHTLSQTYNGRTTPKLVVFSPIAAEDLGNPNLPDGSENNQRLALYARAMAEVAAANNVLFVDLFEPSAALYGSSDEPLTINGVHLNEAGNRAIAPVIVDGAFGPAAEPVDWAALEPLREAVLDKNFHWFHRYRTTDGYSTYGGRADLEFVDGQTNREVVQRELEILDAMSANRDARTWAVAQGKDYTIDDTNTPPFIPVVSNKPGEGPNGEHIFLSGEESLAKMTAGEGLEVTLVADESMFPELANPVQMSFDAKGRLWVAVWPSYPHWKPKDEMDDKLLILEDTDGDGRADVCKTFAGGLHNPTGFEFYGNGVIVGMVPDLLYLEDTDGDDVADVRTRILTGFDSADSHHSINSFVLDPGGGLYFQEGVFHRTQVETPYGPVRNINAGVWRFEPRTSKLERYVPFDFANPHGHVFTRWGQDFVTDGTGAQTYHAALFSGYLDFPAKHPQPPQVYQQRTRPCPATEILSSRHFPEEFQGNLLVGNVIGFSGVLRYRVEPKGSSFTATELEPIIFSSDPNFRPSDLETGPDGALYFVDWHNPIIGHMQHNLRDPNRDKTHGRVYRITYKGRPLVTPESIADQPIPTLLDRLKSTEDRVRYRARIELAGRDTDEVVAASEAWILRLDPDDPDYQHHLTEALWLHQAHNVVNEPLLRQMLRSPDHNARAAATRVLCLQRDRVSDPLGLLAVQAEDAEPLVRMEAVRACSYFDEPRAAEIALLALKQPTDVYLDYVLKETMRQLEPLWKNAIAAGTPIAADNPAGIDYLLGSVSTNELVRLPRTALVYQAMLSRPQVPPQFREEALAGLATLNGTSPRAELLAALERLDQGDPGRAGEVLPELAHLLFEGHHDPADAPDEHAQHQDDPGESRAALSQLATSARLPFTRQVATVALMSTDGSLEPTWTQLATSPARLRDLLDAVSLIPDADLRAQAHERVAPLVTGLPADLEARLGDARGVSGRYVRIELPRPGTLTLAEVQVGSDGKNIAPNGNASQSSTAHRGAARRAIDGNTSGAFADGGQTHTAENDPSPWWELDLGSEVPIEDVVVWNRTESGGQYADRLDGFALKILDGNRQVVFEQVDIPAPEAQARIVLQGDPAGAIRRAAIAAVVSTGVDPEGTFRTLATLIREGDHRAEAIRSLSRIPRDHWPSGEARPLFDAIVADVRALPASERTTPAARSALDLGNELVALLPPNEATEARRTLRDLGVPVIVIRPVPHLILFDKTRIFVEAGKPVEIVFENTDIMPHNLLVARAGTLAKVGVEAEKMAADPNAFARNFVPDLPDVLQATRLLQPGQTDRISFHAPETPGEYPYVCTFPGHWQRMNGIMQVVSNLDDVPPEVLLASSSPTGEAAGSAPIRPFVKAWTVPDLQESLKRLGHSTRNAQRGAQLFRELACVQCHKVEGVSAGGVGPDLADVRTKINAGDLEPFGVLVSLVQPSAEIADEYQTNILGLTSGEIVSGIVVDENDSAITLRSNPIGVEVAEPITVPLDDVEERVVSQVSIMPEGLVNTLTEEEILDLMSYVLSGGSAAESRPAPGTGAGAGHEAHR